MIARSEPAAREQVRDRLHRLDACLDDLERAHERGESILSLELESRLREHVPHATAGMAIARAMGLVFREQERCLLKQGLVRRGGIDQKGWRPVVAGNGAGAGAVAVAHPDATPRPAAAEPDELDLAQLDGIIRQTREMIRVVDNVRDAGRLVRRASAMEKLVDEVVKSCQLLEEEQFELKHEVAETLLRTQRRAGELLAEIEKHRGGRPSTGAGAGGGAARPATLRELGVSQNESHRWQLIAGVPVDLFEGCIADARAVRCELTTSRVLALANRLRRGLDGSGSTLAATGAGVQALGHVSSALSFDPGVVALSMPPEQRGRLREMLRRLRTWIDELELALTA